MNVWCYLGLLMACTAYGMKITLARAETKFVEKTIILYNATPCYLRLTDINAYNYASCT